MTLDQDKVEYKHTGKALTAREVIANGETSINETIQICEWVKKYGTRQEGNYLDDDLFESENFLNYALKHTCFRGFLLDGGYIEKVETWVSPKMGDRFKIIGNEYILISVGINELALINLETGSRLDEAVNVEDATNITKEEFQKICGSIPIDELERI